MVWRRSFGRAVLGVAMIAATSCEDSGNPSAPVAGRSSGGRDGGEGGEAGSDEAGGTAKTGGKGGGAAGASSGGKGGSNVAGSSAGRGDSEGGSAADVTGGAGSGGDVGGAVSGGAGEAGAGAGGGGAHQLPRLFVTQSTSDEVLFWDSANAIASDRAPDGALVSAEGGLGLAKSNDRLVIATSSATNALYFYDGLATLSSASLPTAVMPVSSLGSPLLALSQLAVSAGHLWITDGSIRLFLNVDDLTAASPLQAEFTHLWGQLASSAYEPAAGRLFGGQVSGAGVIGWNAATEATGSDNEQDFTVDTTGVYALALGGNSLYMGQNVAPFIKIWRDVSSLAGSTPADVTIDADHGVTDASALILAGDKLVVVNNSAPSDYKILIYDDATSITSTTLPSSTVTDASLLLPQKVYLDATDHLYVLQSGEVLIFEHASSAPALVATLTAPTLATDLLLVE